VTPSAGPKRPWLALALTVPMPTIGSVAAFGLWPGAVGSAIYLGVKIWAMLLPVWWVVWVDGGRWSWSPARRGGFGLAAGLGLLMSAAVFAAYWVAGDALIDPAQLRAVVEPSGLASKGAFIGAALFYIGVNSVLEEYLFRWFMFEQLAARLPKGAAIAGSALAFTIHHVILCYLQMGAGVAVLAAAGCFVGGAVWSWLYTRTASVWPGWVSHAIVDVALFALGWIMLFE